MVYGQGDGKTYYVLHLKCDQGMLMLEMLCIPFKPPMKKTADYRKVASLF